KRLELIRRKKANQMLLSLPQPSSGQGCSAKPSASLRLCREPSKFRQGAHTKEIARWIGDKGSGSPGRNSEPLDQRFQPLQIGDVGADGVEHVQQVLA